MRSVAVSPLKGSCGLLNEPGPVDPGELQNDGNGSSLNYYKR